MYSYVFSKIPFSKLLKRTKNSWLFAKYSLASGKCRIMKSLIIIILFFTPFYSNAESCNSLKAVSWIFGSWEYKNKDKIITESWNKVSSITLEGNGATYVYGKLKSIESLRIVEMSDSLFYIAKVSHNPLPVAFKLTACTATNAIFENNNHDFPKRIEYKLVEKGKIMVIIGNGESKIFSISFIRTKAS